MLIAHKDPDLLIINKPPGLADPASELVKQFPEIADVGGKDRGACHRLDVGTSGLMVFARNQETYSKMREMFSKNRVKKEYLALVEGEIRKPGKIEWPIGPDPKSAKRVKVYRGKREARRNKALEAVTIFETVPGARFPVLGSGDQSLSTKNRSPGTRYPSPRTWLRIIIKTGRRHQIRAHLAAIGHPIIGDTFYKGPPACVADPGSAGGFAEARASATQARRRPADRLYLHASKLEFCHPRNAKKIVCDAALA